MNVLAPILIPGVDPGVHFLDDTQLAEARSRAVATRGLMIFIVEGGAEIDGKDGFLKAAANAMGFPDYFGHNWDAFEECIRDLGWAPATGYVLLYDRFDRFARADPSAWEIALDIFNSAVQHWFNKGIPFFVLLKGTPTAAEDGPTIHWLDLPDRACPSAVRPEDP